MHIARSIPARSLLAGASSHHLPRRPRRLGAHLVLRKAGSAPTEEASVDHIAVAGVGFHVDGLLVLKPLFLGIARLRSRGLS